MAAIALTCGVAVGPAYAQTRDGGLLPPEESGLITAAGCFLRGGHDDKDFVLAQPKLGPVNSVPEATCSAAAGDNALKLHDTSKYGMNDSMLGHWVEINGRLEKETSSNPDNLRELYVRSFRVLPVVPPQRAAAVEPAPAPFIPAPEPQPEAIAAPAPVATSGQAPAPLPKTAGEGPMAGLIGVLALAGCLLLRSFRSREAV
jgi:hypothetical protein